MKKQTDSRPGAFPSARDILTETRRLLNTPARLRFRLMLALLCVLCITLGPILILDCLLYVPDYADGPAADVIFLCGQILQAGCALFVGLPAAAAVFRVSALAAAGQTDDDPDGASDAPYASGWALAGVALSDSLWCFSSPAAYAACLKTAGAFIAWLAWICLFPAGCVCLFIFGEDITAALPLTETGTVLLGIAAVLVTIGLTFAMLLLSGSPASYGYALFTGSRSCPFVRVLWAPRGTRRTLLLLRLRMTGRYILSILLVLVPLFLIAIPCGMTAGAVYGRASAGLSHTES